MSFSLTALGQSSDDNSGEDPFRNDPFFSKPIQEFFQNSSEDSAEEVSSNSDKEIVQYRLNQLNENGIDYDGLFEAGPYNSVSLYSLYPNLPMIHYNRVSGLFLGIENERMQWYGDNWLEIPSIQTTGLIGYSFAQKEWNYSLGLEKLIGRKKYMMLGAEYHDAMATDDFWRIGLTETTLTSFFAGYDYQDYYKQQGYGLYVLLRSRRLFEGGVSFNDNRYSSLITKTDWALFGSGNRYRENPPIEFIFGTPVDTLNLSSLSFSGSFNPKRLVLSRHFTFSLSGMVEIADPGITSSDYDYTKYIGELATYINFEPGGVLKYRLMMGSITGNAPNFKEFQLGGVGSLRALPYKSLAGNSGSIDHYANQMILSNAEIQFGSPSYNNDSWIDFEDFYLSFFLDSGWANYSADLADNSSPFTDFDQFDFSDLRHNGGIGLGSSLIRCELAWDLNETSRSPVFWIRFNPTF
ncbi:hypothetical protein NC796_07745 [Aliifodinibius sp. S!AR15-10]|uniref:hypothetical protein n=1 Tax=Aliifodinibius sp. S!AR15-10 TaxID=2950437 RepID=UPI00285C9E24|nr:hypothetical protein [Aliifodinibius sp. S!AR15-10]MDR8391025.1 hypothetical protein [Aliifodinibius sp. S!AR15-10]